MISFPLKPFQLDPFLQTVLQEDLGQGDLTTEALIDPQTHCNASIITKQTGILSGLPVAIRVFTLLDPTLSVMPQATCGSLINKGDTILTLQGSAASILQAERTALNFLQHLCGIATLTQQFVQALQGTPSQITDTRKTTPGLRLLEKRAVMDGGGAPHRFNLGSAAMIKDNHRQLQHRSSPSDSAAGDSDRNLYQAIQTLRSRVSHTVRIEVEADTLSQVEIALNAGADIIMLDNMTPAQVQEAVTRIGSKAITEASGGITLGTVRAFAETGVQFISTSQITLGAPTLDLSLDIQATSSPSA